MSSPDNPNDEARRRRAEQRRATWTAEVVPAGTPKPPLYAGTTIEQRFALMTQLCRRQWLASGREIITLPRSEWPGEVFEIKHGPDRASD